MAPVALGESDRTRAKPISAADAAALVASGDWVEYGTGIGQPDFRHDLERDARGHGLIPRGVF